jgi:hypothetical protein
MIILPGAELLLQAWLRKGAVVKQIDYLTEQDLAEIVERASTVDERLSGDFSTAEGDEALVDERLEAWCRALGKGDWERFERRLAWDGLDLETIRPALGPVRLREGVPLPE